MAKQKKRIQPTDAELEILQVIWENGPSTVRFVNDQLNKKKHTGYTTTLKLMQIMNEKGILNRKVDGRVHTYNSVLDEETTQSIVVDKMLNLAFGGSASKLVLQALGNKSTTPDELKKIKQLIAELEKKGQ